MTRSPTTSILSHYTSVPNSNRFSHRNSGDRGQKVCLIQELKYLVYPIIAIENLYHKQNQIQKSKLKSAQQMDQS